MVVVHRRLIILIAWALTTTVVAGVSWFGIRSAFDRVGPERRESLSVAEIGRAVTVTEVPPPGGPIGSASSSAAPSNPTSASPLPSDLASESPGGSVETWIQATDERGADGYRRTVRTVGGEAVVWSAKAGCRVLGTTPRPGFSVTTQAGGETATVTFERSDQRTTAVITVRWQGNAPVAEVAETIGYR